MQNKTNNQDISLILNRIKKAYNLNSNAALAAFLGVAPNTITNWYGRNTVDFKLIFSKCVGLNLDWLITGEGEMLKTASVDTVELKAAPLHNEIIELLKSQLAEKEKKIDELNKAIGRLESEIDKDKSPERDPKLADKVASKS